MFYHVDALRAEIPALVFEVVVASTDFAEDFVSRFTLKWQTAADDHVQNAAERPDVALARVIAVQNLWRHEVGRAGKSLHASESLLCESKVDEAHLAVSSKHDVFWLQVSVDNVLRVAMLQRLQTRANDFCCVFFGVSTALVRELLNTVEKLAIRAVFHD